MAFNIGTATASYWDTATSGQATSVAGTGQMTSALQTPTSASGLYATWGAEWDFGTASQYPVLKVDVDGDGTATWEEFGDQRPVPPAPASLTATPAPTSVALTWAAVSGAAKYRVAYRASDAASWTTASDTLTTTTATVANLTCTTAYEFRVSAYGNGTTYTAAWGAATTPVPATTSACAPVFGAAAYTFAVAADAAVGTVVGTVTATGRGDATISYALTPSDGDAASFALDTNSGALTVAALLTAAGTSYQLTVEAGVGSGDAAPSASVPVTVTVQGAPAAPATLSATPAMTSVALTWATVPGAATYRVEYRTSGADSWSTASDTLTALTHTVADLTCATAYAFRVSAAGDAITHTAAWGAATTPVPATTSACAPGFGAAAYTFAVAADAAVGTLVGTVTATGMSDATISYALTPSDGDAASFALDTNSGALTVAAPLAAAGTSYQLTVAARAGSGDAAPRASVPVTVTVQGAPPAPGSLRATPAMTSVALTWATVPGASRYQVDYLVAGGESWTTASAMVTTLMHTIADLTCNTAYQFRVSASGDAITHTAAWGAATTPVPATTTTCVPVFDVTPYTFTVSESAGEGAVVGMVTATPTGGGTVTYAITAGNAAGTFAIDRETGQLTVTGTLDAASYALTISATEANGGTATVAVAIAVSTATDTATPTPTATGTATATPTPTATGTATATPTPTATATATATPTPTATGTATATPTATATATATPTPTATGTATATPTATATATATATPTATATTTPPARPQHLRHVAGYDQVFLFWDDPDDSSITGYRILRRNPAADPPGQFAILVENTGSAGNRYTDRSVAPETGYVYRIQARNAAGQLSERSGYTRADTAPAPTATPTPTPTATATVGD